MLCILFVLFGPSVDSFSCGLTHWTYSPFSCSAAERLQLIIWLFNVCLGETAGDVYRWLNRRWHHMTTSVLLTRQVLFFYWLNLLLKMNSPSQRVFVDVVSSLKRTQTSWTCLRRRSGAATFLILHTFFILEQQRARRFILLSVWLFKLWLKPFLF